MLKELRLQYQEVKSKRDKAFENGELFEVVKYNNKLKDILNSRNKYMKKARDRMAVSNLERRL